VGPVDIKKLIKTNISFFECGNIAIDNVYEEILIFFLTDSLRSFASAIIQIACKYNDHRGNCSGKKAT